MEEMLRNFLGGLSLPLLFFGIAFFLYLLSKGADFFVDGAVALSEEFHISKMVIGATIVSLGTTLPEVSVSLVASLSGDSQVSMGNAVGSIICNTALIIGIASLISPLTIQKNQIKKQTFLQLGGAIIIILLSLPYSFKMALKTGGNITRLEGVFLLLLLAGYIYLSVRWIRRDRAEAIIPDDAEEDVGHHFTVFAKLISGIIIVTLSSKILLPIVQVTALKLGVPNSVIAATLVAFGTSVPELVTSVNASLKGHGELAIGNVTGANILNVLFVIGVSSSFSRHGIHVTPNFFTFYFPIMLLVIGIFTFGALLSKEKFGRIPGGILLLIYVIITIKSYL